MPNLLLSIKDIYIYSIPAVILHPQQSGFVANSENEDILGAIAISCPPFVIDDSSWKNAAESFTIALTLTLRGYKSAIAPHSIGWKWYQETGLVWIWFKVFNNRGFA